jgi:hypothetical protein
MGEDRQPPKVRTTDELLTISPWTNEDLEGHADLPHPGAGTAQALVMCMHSLPDSMPTTK